MIKTQIQLPDALYKEIKRVAREREMSLAEVLRRGAEYITSVYPPIDPKSTDTGLPGPFNVGLTEDPFASPDWRYDLHERGSMSSVVRESPGVTRGKNRRMRK